MKMKKVLSILTAVAMSATAFAGLSASAATYYTQSYAADTTADWTSGNTGRYTVDIAEKTAGSGDYCLNINAVGNGNNGTTVSTNSNFVGVAAGTDFTLSFDMKLDGGSNQASSFLVNGTDGYLMQLAAKAADSETWYLNDTTTEVTVSKSAWYTYKITRQGENTFLTITAADGTKVYDTASIPTTSVAGGLKGMTYNTKRYWAYCGIDNVVVRDIEDGDVPSIPTVDYTINYNLDGTPISTVTASDFEGVEIAADSAIWVDDVKYIVTSETTTITLDSTAESNVLNVDVRVADTYTGNVIASTGDVVGTYSVVEGDSFTYSNSKYLTDADKKVTAVADGNVFTTTVAPTSNDDIVVPYTAYEGVAYFAEYENISDNSENPQYQYSGGNARRAENDGAAAFTVAEAGMYKITVAASCRNSGASSVFAVYKNEVAEGNLIFNGDVKGASQNTVQTTGTKTTENDVELAAGDVIILQGDAGNTWVDYILVEKTADIAEPEIITEISVINQYVNGTVLEDGTEVEGDATSLKAIFTISGETAFNYVSFTVSDVTAEKAVTTVSGDGATVTYGIIVDAVIEADAVTSAVSFVE